MPPFRLLSVPLLLSAVALAACESATAPRADRAPSARALASRAASDTTDSSAKANAGLLLGYSATQLPLVPSGINDSGVIVGTDGSYAVRYFNGEFTRLQKVVGRAGNYVGQAINRRGAMAGHIDGGAGLFWNRPDESPQPIDPPGDDVGNSVYVASMNNADMVVGSFNHRDRATGDVSAHAFRWRRNGLMEDITPVGYQFAYATDVNDVGNVVGYGWKPNGPVRALRWSPQSPGYVEELAYDGTTATAISANGTTIGTADLFTTTRYWSMNGVTAALPGPQAASPEDISYGGRLVGYTYKYSPINPHRPWTVVNGTTTWLPVPNAANTYNVYHLRVNSCGSIIGQQEFNGGVSGGVLWTKFQCDLLPTAP